jgi:hypothetical protein
MDDTRDLILVRRRRGRPGPWLAAVAWAAAPALASLALPGLPRAPRLILALALGLSLFVWRRVRAAGGRRARARHEPAPRPSSAPGADARSIVPAAPVLPAAAAPRAPREAWSGRAAWLHVVSAADRAPLRRATLEAAVTLLECGEGVVIVDGAKRLGLHDLFRFAEGPGLLECLTGEAAAMRCARPVRDGLWLVPRGGPYRAEAWPQLGRLLDDLRPHFGRVVLALDFATPHEAGPALVERGAAGWWCRDGGPRGLALALAERLGIPLREIALTLPDEALLEIAGAVLGDAPVERPPVAAPAVPPPPAPPAAAPRPAGPITVDCDLQTRERLRFLLWAHRMREASRRDAEAPLPRT